MMSYDVLKINMWECLRSFWHLTFWNLALFHQLKRPQPNIFPCIVLMKDCVGDWARSCLCCVKSRFQLLHPAACGYHSLEWFSRYCSLSLCGFLCIDTCSLSVFMFLWCSWLGMMHRRISSGQGLFGRTKIVENLLNAFFSPPTFTRAPVDRDLNRQERHKNQL